MGDDTISGGQLLNLQKEALAGNFHPEMDEHPDDGSLYGDQMIHDVWKWCIENGESPRDVERTLIRYSTNFSPVTDGTPLALGDEPPESLQEEYPDWEDKVGPLAYE